MPRLDHLRPSGLHHNPAYSHVVTASGARTIYISGQVSVDEEGRIVGEGDLAAQHRQVAFDGGGGSRRGASRHQAHPSDRADHGRFPRCPSRGQERHPRDLLSSFYTSVAKWQTG